MLDCFYSFMFGFVPEIGTFVYSFNMRLRKGLVVLMFDEEVVLDCFYFFVFGFVVDISTFVYFSS